MPYIGDACSSNNCDGGTEYFINKEHVGCVRCY